MKETAAASKAEGWWRSGDEPVLTVKLALILVAVVCAWAFALVSSQRLQLDPSRGSLAWAHACPTCGTVETALVLPDSPPASGASSPSASPLYRLTVRMADGTVRLFHRSTVIVPGTQVMVDGLLVRPVTAANPAQPERQ